MVLMVVPSAFCGVCHRDSAYVDGDLCCECVSFLEELSKLLYYTL